MIFSEQSTERIGKLIDLYYNKIKEAIEDLLPDGFTLSKWQHARRDMRKPVYSPRTSFNIARLETPSSGYLLLTIPQTRGGLYITRYGYVDTIEELRSMIKMLVSNEIRLSAKRKMEDERHEKRLERIRDELNRIWSNDAFGEYLLTKGKSTIYDTYRVSGDHINVDINIISESIPKIRVHNIGLSGNVTHKINGMNIIIQFWAHKLNYLNIIKLLHGDFDFNGWMRLMWDHAFNRTFVSTNAAGQEPVLAYHVWKFFRVVNGKPIIPQPELDDTVTIIAPTVTTPSITFITHTDYGPAGVVIKRWKGRSLPNDGADVIIRLLSMQQISYHPTLDSEEISALVMASQKGSLKEPCALPKELLDEVNDSFREQILKLRVRKEVSKARGKFEGIVRLNVIYEDLKIEQSIVQDIIELLSPILSKYSNISIRPIASVSYSGGYGNLVEIYQVDTGESVGRIAWGPGDSGADLALYVGVAHGPKHKVSSDEDLFQAVDNMIMSASRMKHKSRPPRPPRPSGVRPHSGSPERFPGQRFYKDVNDDQYFSRKIYVRKGEVPGTATAAKVAFSSPGTPFMLSIHATDVLAKWPGPGEPGFPQGIFTGLDLHMISTFGKRPGHVGWIGGTINSNVIYILEVQSDLMQRTWDMIDRTERDVSRSIGKGKTKEVIMSLKYRMREIASAMKMERMELAKLRSAQYGRVEDAYTSMGKVAELDRQYRTIRARYNKFSRLPMFYEFKSKVENTFKDWIDAFYNDAMNYAREVGVDTIKIITTSKAMEAHHVKDAAETDVIYRVYDGAAKSLGAEITDDGWWTLNLIKNENFDQKLELVLNENIYGNVATVYHGTKSASAAKSMATWGHFPGLRGAYGQGVYAIYDDAAVARHIGYGNYMIKYMVNMDGFLILNKDAKIVYGDKCMPSDQLDKMGIPWRKMGDRFEELDPWELNISLAHTDVPDLVNQLDSSFPNSAFAHNILTSPLRAYLNGIFFTGGHGKELIGFDSSVFKPIAFGIRAGDNLKWYKITDENIKILDKHIEAENARD